VCVFLSPLWFSALKARAALGGVPFMFVFLGPLAQSAKLIAAKGAMELTFRVCYVARLQRAISGGMLTQGCATGATLG
jgi:hypothetical protein